MNRDEWVAAVKPIQARLAQIRDTAAVKLFEEMDSAVMVFFNHREKGTAEAARRQLKQWMTATGRPGDDEERFKQQSLVLLSLGGAAKLAVTKMYNAIVTYQLGPVFNTFETKARRLLALYAGRMTDTYAMKLEAIFIGRSPLDEDQHFLLLDDGKFARFFGMHGSASSSYPLQGVNAFTAPALRPTEEPPANRRIHLREHNWTAETIFHELLHWCTHQQYEEAARQYNGDQNNAIIEGVTEYFTRKAHPRRTNFAVELGHVETCLKSPGFSEQSLMEAYFQGAGVGNVTRTIAAGSQPEAAPRWALPAKRTK